MTIGKSFGLLAALAVLLACQADPEACDNHDEDVLLQLKNQQLKGDLEENASEGASEEYYSDEDAAEEGEDGPGLLQDEEGEGDAEDAEGSDMPEWMELGCFRMAKGDVSSGASVFEDRACMIAASGESDYTTDEPCRSGLPFFRLHMKKEQGPVDCQRFCMSKGLDIAGMVDMRAHEGSHTTKLECRCGASAKNKVAWHVSPGTDEKPPAAMMLSDNMKVESQDHRCKILAWQLQVKFENHGVPEALTEISLTDTSYLDDVATGSTHEEEEGEEVQPKLTIRDGNKIEGSLSNGETGGLDPKDPESDGARVANTSDCDELSLSDIDVSGVSLLSTSSNASSQGLCDDYWPTGIKDGAGRDLTCSVLKGHCKAAGDVGAAIIRRCPLTCKKCTEKGDWLPCYPDSCGPGGGVWPGKNADGNVYINYFFQKGLDGDRKRVFKAATKMYEEHTCLRFVESDKVPRIRVAVVNPNSCSSGVGFPGAKGTNTINMGWCKDTRHEGNIVHEIGHAIGMNHENKRPDATNRIETPTGASGPYIQVMWHNIPQSWVPQYVADDRSYIGSGSSGYSHYDYSSIMHYAPGGKMKANSAIHTKMMGQRSHLSEGDIYQIMDTYACKGKPAEAFEGNGVKR